MNDLINQFWDGYKKALGLESSYTDKSKFEKCSASIALYIKSLDVMVEKPFNKILILHSLITEFDYACAVSAVFNIKPEVVKILDSFYLNHRNLIDDEGLADSLL